jgi:methyl-accepting chemotaxis protein
MSSILPARKGSIGRRLALVLSGILGLSLFSSAVAVWQLRALGAEVEDMLQNSLKVERAASDWMRNTSSGVQRAAAIAKSTDASLIEYFAPATAAAIKETNELQKQIEASLDTPEERELFARIGELRKAYLSSREAVSKAKQAGDVDGAARLFAERFEPASKTYLEAVAELTRYQRAELDKSSAQVEALRSRTVWLLVACTGLALAVGTVLSVLLSRSITVPLRDAERSASRTWTSPASPGAITATTRPASCCMPSTRCAMRCGARCRRCAAWSTTSPPPARRSPPATST